ncbi:telomeric repeat binding protein 1 [Actinidia rufa]|uniref:Telomeric repeat binding protein 1 n=1 Tax=Actinidia rufa TaxID=165716 RepID=A0A7J0D8Z9_9ERIC|nr:telomeric repeat binding protein 1 [Actinidia rufa]
MSHSSSNGRGDGDSGVLWRRRLLVVASGEYDGLIFFEWVLLWGYAEFIIECVMPDLFHVVLIAHNTMLNWVPKQSLSTIIGRFVTNAKGRKGIILSKKKKLYDHSSVSNSDRGTSSKDMTTFPGKGFSCDAPGLGATMNGASGTSARVAGHYTISQSKDSHVKLRIKSFRVPELFIEIPESATVGSLKRRVMEAVTTILGGGLRIGVLLQGKKLRNDEKSLLQTGICHDNKLDALCFSLEPSLSQAPPPLCHEDCPFCSLPTHLSH